MNKHDRDKETLYAIGRIYCSGNHVGGLKDSEGMCAECRRIVERTLERADKCPHGHEHNCDDCDTHCQQGDDRMLIRRIMRYSAPRMACRHPVMTIQYLRKKIIGKR